MDKNQKNLLTFGAIAITLGYHQYKINRTAKALGMTARVMAEYMRLEQQTIVDRVFENIVRNYEE